MGPGVEGASPARAVPFLEDVDELSDGTCGSLTFHGERDPLGVILVQDRRVCWATARGMRGRLTDILIGESSGTLDRAGVEALYARCRNSRQPLGEALVEAGVVSASGLRAALLRHVAEALLVMGQQRRSPPAWDEHPRGTYDARFTFSTAEIYASLCASAHAVDAVDAAAVLHGSLAEGCRGIAFVRDGGGQPVALVGEHGIGTRELCELGGWVISSLDIAEALADQSRLVVFGAGPDAAALWRYEDCLFLALCREPSELTYLMAKRRSEGAG